MPRNSSTGAQAGGLRKRFPPGVTCRMLYRSFLMACIHQNSEGFMNLRLRGGLLNLL